MTGVILGISMTAALLGGIIKKYCGDRFENKAMMYHVYNAIVSIVSVIVLLVISDNLNLSAFTVGLGIVFGMVTALGQIFSLKAFEVGPFAYTCVIASLSTIIPALSGHFIWKEQISSIQVVGMLLMVVCFVCSVDFSKREEKKKPLSMWFVYTFLTFLCTGFVGVMQKWHQNTVHKTELDGFLVIAFTVSFLYSLGCFLLSSVKKPEERRIVLKKDLGTVTFLLIVLGGVCAAANNKLNLYLSGVMDSAVFFPVVNGGGLVLTTIASLAIFKERLSAQKWVGVMIGIVSVLLLCSSN